MIRRVFLMLAGFGGGSLRKRLYIRLAVVAVLLSTGVWGIAQMQRATRNSKNKQVKSVAAKNDNRSQQAERTEPSNKRPQPIPGRPEDRDTSFAGKDDDPQSYTDDNDTYVYGGGSDEDDRSNNNRSNDGRSNNDGLNQYSYLDESSGYNTGDNDGDEDVTTVSDTATDQEQEQESDGESQATGETGSSGNNKYSLSDITSSTDPGESSGSSSDEEAIEDDQGESVESDETVSSSELAEDDASEEPARLLIRTDEDADSEVDAADLDEEDSASSGLASLQQERAALQPVRSENVATTPEAASTAKAAPSLLTNSNRSNARPSSRSGSGASESPSVALPPSPGLETNSPELEGLQMQSVTVEKTAPDEVQVGRPATFEIYVRNVGQAPAKNVIVTDRVPQGALLNETSPTAEQMNGTLVWNLGSMEPGAEARLSVTVTPQVEGYIGSSAEVTFAAQAAARTISTKPELKVEIEAPSEVLIGDWVDVIIRVRNDGTGPARGVVIEADVPDGLKHSQGRELEQELGVLRPREVRELKLVLAAEKSGTASNIVRVRDDGNIDLLESANVNIIAPKLSVGVEGPRLRYLERQATYDLAVSNVGTAVAKNVELIVRLPANLEFMSADKLGQYDVQQHAVFWNLEELPPQKTGTVRLVTLPIQEGNRQLRVEAYGDLADTAEAQKDVTVESISELTFSVSDSADPIEVGSDTIYEIEVTNQGSKTDTNIVLAMALPDELEPVKGEGPTRGQISGQQIQFEPLSQLAAGDSVIYRIQAKGRIAGDPRILVQLTSEQMPKPVSKEESTKVYSD